MAQVTIYTTRYCPYCLSAKALLKRKGVMFQEIAVDGDAALRRGMAARAQGRSSVPQIFIDGVPVGGSDELYDLEDARPPRQDARRNMIRYDLVCADGHEFDGWFRDSAAYDSAERLGELACSICGSPKVAKQLMAPGIPAKSNAKAELPVAGGALDPKAQAMLRMMREVRREVEAKAEYVGPRFAEEARKIHYKETVERGIYGEASQVEARSLIEEGISVHPLPRLPEDGN